MRIVKNLKDVLKDIDKDGKYSRYKNYRPKKKGLGSVDLFDFLDLTKSWHKVVGPRLSQFTIPLKLNGKFLTVLTSHPVYAQQLKYMENEIIKSIGNVLPATQGHISKVFFQVDNKFFSQKKEKIENLYQGYRKDFPEVEEIRAIELKELLSDPRIVLVVAGNSCVV